MDDRRRLLKTYLLIERGPRCEVCGRETMGHPDLHEIVPRSRIQGNRLAEHVLFSLPHLGALVCPACHASHAGIDAEATRALWLNNIHRYGREAVQAALDLLAAALKSPLGVALPEE